MCDICSDPKRDPKTICVVEDFRVLMASKTLTNLKDYIMFLGGLISPMDGIGPKDIKVEELVEKVENGNVQEIILPLVQLWKEIRPTSTYLED